MPSPEQSGRPPSIEDYSNLYVVHPLSGLVVTSALSLGVGANFVSVLGLGAGLLAAMFYSYQPHPGFVMAGFLAMVVWHILDGADGRIARATGTSSAFGRIVDGLCDHIVFAAVYVVFALHMTDSGASQFTWLLVLCAGASHAVQAAGYEERRQKYQRRLRGIGRATIAETLVRVGGRKSVLARFYDEMQRFVSNADFQLDLTLAAMKNRGVSECDIQAAIEDTARIVRAWAILNANKRTVMLALAAFVGHPALYFVYEVVVLNLALVALQMFEHKSEAAIAQRLENPMA